MPRTKKSQKDETIGEVKCTCNDTPPKQEEVKSTLPKDEPPKKKRGRKPKEVIKKERVASSYATFVKTHYDSVRNLPTKERFKALSVLWKQEKKKA